MMTDKEFRDALVVALASRMIEANDPVSLVFEQAQEFVDHRNELEKTENKAKRDKQHPPSEFKTPRKSSS